MAHLWIIPCVQVAAGVAIQGCSRNETNKTLLREFGAIEALLKMLPFSNARDAQASAVGALSFLTLNEDEARVLLRLQGGIKKLQALLYADDPLLQANAAQVFARPTQDTCPHRAPRTRCTAHPEHHAFRRSSRTARPTTTRASPCASATASSRSSRSSPRRTPPRAWPPPAR